LCTSRYIADTMHYKAYTVRHITNMIRHIAVTISHYTDNTASPLQGFSANGYEGAAASNHGSFPTTRKRGGIDHKEDKRCTDLLSINDCPRQPLPELPSYFIAVRQQSEPFCKPRPTLNTSRNIDT